MTAHQHPQRSPLTGLRTRASVEADAAAQRLGPDHALTRALRASRTATEQLLTLTVLDAAAAGLMSGGAASGAPLLVTSLLLQWGIALWLMITRQEIHDESRALVIAGGAPVTLTSVERERRRLLDPRTREHLARSVEDLVRRARKATPADPDLEPFAHLSLVRRFEPELREVASLLRADTTDSVGVALVERLLKEAGSPIYGLHENVVRDELSRIRSHLLAVGT